MKWLWEWTSSWGVAAWNWRDGRRRGLACVAALAVAGCGYAEPPKCFDVDSPDDCLALVDEPPVGEPPVGEPPVGEPPIDEPPANTFACDLYPVEGSATGICVPYVDAGWHTMLARMAYLPKSQLRCPDSAPNAGLSGVEIPNRPVEPRRVIGCSVNPLSTCSSPALACVPFELDYPACITQSGLHDCPSEYPTRTSVEEDGLGAEVTVCCRPPDEAT